jgi:hypothetical protein
MPIGITINFFAILLGGLIGAVSHRWIPDNIKALLPSIFGGCGLALGITFIVKVVNLPPVILALIIGTIIGQSLNIEDKLTNLSKRLQTKLQKGSKEVDEKTIGRFVTLLVLFSAGNGIILGSLYEGMTGDTTLLMVKSILDFFTAIIFATSIGYLVMFISIPTLVVGMTLFYLATIILPNISDVMTADFAAGGGILTMFIGLRMMEVKKLPVANMIPAIILFMPFSYLWTLFF